MVVFAVFDISLEFSRFLKLGGCIFGDRRVSGYGSFCRHFT